jgi:hypothetical protein
MLTVSLQTSLVRIVPSLAGLYLAAQFAEASKFAMVG